MLRAGSRTAWGGAFAAARATRMAATLGPRVPAAPSRPGPATVHAPVSLRLMSGVAGKDREGEEKSAAKPGFLEQIMGKDTCVAPEGATYRWAVVIPAMAAHMCIGAPWGWSVMSGTVSRELGMVASAAADWGMSEATYPLGICFAFQGISAALMGKWAMSVGPRMSMAAASLCFGGGWALAGLGVDMHSLPLMYLGYGVLGGAGVGLAYTPPVQTLISWFPDKKGLASGLTIAGFGSGALVFTPMANNLMDYFSKMPTYLGTMDQVSTVTKDGKLFADAAGTLTEVVQANAADLAKLPYDLAEGLYVVGSGSTGAATTLATCGGIYGAAMLAAAFLIRTPHPTYQPAGWDPNAAPAAGSTPPAPKLAGNVSPDTVMLTPQFYLLASTFFCVACGGMGIMSVAKPMMGEVFSGALPAVVTAAFASMYVQMLAGSNLTGRIAWAAFSDRFGRRTTFNMFTMGSIPLYLAIPYSVQQVVETGSAVPLGMFIGSTLVAISFMGGVFSILPAYEADLFGAKYVGPIHGRMLLGSSAAALAGPSVLLTLRSRSEADAITGLLEKVQPERFQETFGVGMDQAPSLIESKALTIGKLMDMVPAGTVDPTPFIYDSTMYTMAGLMAVAAVSHSMVRPVSSKHFEGAAVAAEALAAPGPFAEGGMPTSMASHMIPAAALPRVQ